MESRAAVFGHPLHAIVVDFPLGLLPTAFLFDLIYLWRGDPFWRRAAFWLVLLGETAALTAIPIGLVDYLLIAMPPETRQLATVHLYLGLLVAATYGIQLWLRRGHGRVEPPSDPPRPAFMALSLLCVVLLLGQGAIGGELSHGRRVGVAAAPAPAWRPAGAAAAGASPALVAAGRRVYGQHCAGCHGEAGAGKTGPRLAGTPHRREEVRRTVVQGRFPLMPAFRQLPPADLDSVAAYVESLGPQ